MKKRRRENMKWKRGKKKKKKKGKKKCHKEREAGKSGGWSCKTAGWDYSSTINRTGQQTGRTEYRTRYAHRFRFSRIIRLVACGCNRSKESRISLTIRLTRYRSVDPSAVGPYSWAAWPSDSFPCLSFRLQGILMPHTAWPRRPSHPWIPRAVSTSVAGTLRYCE